MAYEHILVETSDAVTTITLNRPDKLNACLPRMGAEIRDVLADPGAARAIVLTGSGRAFCSGADLSGDGEESLTGGRQVYDALVRDFNPLMVEFARCPVPIVSAVNGAAAGIGCSIALGADFTIAGASAYFLQAFVNVGLVPDGGASWLLPRLVGKARATEMMLLGEKIPAQKAADWGLIYKAVADEDLHGEAQALARRLASGPTFAIGIMRRNIAKALDLDYTAALHQEAEGQWKAGKSQDAFEGTAAFLQKRKPEFKGG